MRRMKTYIHKTKAYSNVEKKNEIKWNETEWNMLASVVPLFLLNKINSMIYSFVCMYVSESEIMIKSNYE